jgi:hypothetical protein
VGTSVAPVAVGTGAAPDGAMAVSMERQIWSALERIRTPWS